MAFRKSFDSERDLKWRFANHLIQTGLKMAFHESFDSERDLKCALRESFRVINEVFVF